MYEYNIIYLTTGINYPNGNENVIPLEKRNEYIKELDISHYWQLDLIEQLNCLSDKGWELVQMPENMINGCACDGFGVFRRKCITNRKANIQV